MDTERSLSDPPCLGALCLVSFWRLFYCILTLATHYHFIIFFLVSNTLHPHSLLLPTKPNLLKGSDCNVFLQFNQHSAWPVAANGGLLTWGWGGSRLTIAPKTLPHSNSWSFWLFPYTVKFLEMWLKIFRCKISLNCLVRIWNPGHRKCSYIGEVVRHKIPCWKKVTETQGQRVEQGGHRLKKVPSMGQARSDPLQVSRGHYVSGVAPGSPSRETGAGFWAPELRRNKLLSLQVTEFCCNLSWWP